MSYEGYEDLFEKAQISGQYHLFIYDIVNSRKGITQEERGRIVKLIFQVYQRIEELEEREHRSILHRNKILSQGKLEIKNTENGDIYDFDYTGLPPKKIMRRPDLLEPFYLAGDLYEFTIERGTLTAEQIDQIFEQEKKKLNITQEFHKANGYYETDEYDKGDKLYFRGYCIQQLEKMSKKEKEIER